MALSPLALAAPLRRRSGWQDVARVGIFVGALSLLGLVAIQLFLLKWGLAGVAQRVVLALVITWMLASAGRLIATGSMEG